MAYLAFWVHTPERVTDLNLSVKSDDGTKIWLNGQLIHHDETIVGPGISNAHRLPLPLEAGWNRVLVKVGQLDGPWSFSARFESTVPGLIGKLRVSVTPEMSRG